MLKDVWWRPQWFIENVDYLTHSCEQHETLWCCCNSREIRNLQTKANRESKEWYLLLWLCFSSVLSMDKRRLDIWDTKRRKVRRKYEESLETWWDCDLPMENREELYFPVRNGIFLPLKQNWCSEDSWPDCSHWRPLTSSFQTPARAAHAYEGQRSFKGSWLWTSTTF